MGFCSALGPTLRQCWPNLLQGKSGISWHQPFPDLSPYPLAMLASQPVRLNALLDLTLTDLLEDLQVGDTQGLPFPQTSWGVAIGSSRGYQYELESLSKAWHRQGIVPSDLDWCLTYGPSPAGYIAQKLQIAGPVLAPRAACATGLWAIAQGVDLIRTGQCKVVIAGAAEAPITPLTLAGFTQIRALAPEGAYPFDQRRAGFVLGEGAALLLLERRDHAEARGAKPYGKILGFGCTNDAYHRSAPAPNRKMAIAAIQNCLDRSHLQSHQVDYIHAHGTGTQLNDEMEAQIIQAVFPQSVAVSSTKGATGHTLGASGAMSAGMSLMALQDQVVPPCVGLQNPAYDLNLTLQSQPQALNIALCFSFGFGGQNAVLAFSTVK